MGEIIEIHNENNQNNENDNQTQVNEITFLISENNNLKERLNKIELLYDTLQKKMDNLEEKIIEIANDVYEEDEEDDDDDDDDDNDDEEDDDEEDDDEYEEF